MYKRCLILFGTFMALFCLSLFNLDYISHKNFLKEAATGQQSYKLKVASTRGTIYDCRNQPLVNIKKKLIAAVTPSVEVLQALTPVVKPSEVSELYKKCSGKTPFTIEITEKIKSPFVKIFEVPIRYSDITMAPHIIGYTSSDGHGVCGIEKIFDDYLSGENNEIYVKYETDAFGRILPGIKEVAKDRSYLNFRGVALNLDSRIEAIVEDTANKYITKGAVIVTEVPNCEIRACYSLPSFLPQSVGRYINDAGSPLINRSLCQFNLGSIFKLITAAAAIECGVSPEFEYDCTGKNQVEDTKFRCFNSKKHGKITLEKAIAESCNGYFIELAKKLPDGALLRNAQKFGLGKPVMLNKNLLSSSGKLPTEKSLEDSKTLANFSFGQGKLLATPLQISAVINAIASDGVYQSPKLIKGLVDGEMKVRPVENDDSSGQSKKDSKHIISAATANILKTCMQAAVNYGTAQKGKPETTDAAAKTSTAQTGIIENGKRAERSWIGGMFPVDRPKYCIVVLSEDGAGGGEACGPTFKEIIDRMHLEASEIFVE